MILLLGFMMALNVTLSAWLTFQEEVIYAYEGIPMPSWFERWGLARSKARGTDNVVLVDLLTYWL